MSEYKALSLSECADAVLSVKKPLVVMHLRPDGDTVASGAALCEIFKELGRDVKYLCPDPIPQRLAFLVEGLESQDAAEGYEAVSIDVPSPTQLGPVLEKLDVKFMIDHHEISTPFAPHYTIGGESSAGEVLLGVARELEARGALKITKKIAALIYAAMSSDTGGFAYSNAGEKTYRNAADLIAYGIDHADINHRLFNSKSREILRAEGFVAAKIMTEANGKIAYATISKAEMNELNLDFAYFDCAIDIVRSLLGAEIAFVAKETPKGEYKFSLRSTGANVAEVAGRYSGGGHIRAAGCTVAADSIELAAKIMVNELKKII